MSSHRSTNSMRVRGASLVGTVFLVGVIAPQSALAQPAAETPLTSMQGFNGVQTYGEAPTSMVERSQVETVEELPFTGPESAVWPAAAAAGLGLVLRRRARAVQMRA